MSLQAHTESPSLADRVPLPELSDKLYQQLCRVAAKYAVPVDDVAEYIFVMPGDARTAADLAAMKRAAAEVEQAKLMREARAAGRTVPCRNGGTCPATFVWGGTRRCGCAKLRKHVYAYGPVADACITCGHQEDHQLHSVGP